MTHQLLTRCDAAHGRGRSCRADHDYLLDHPDDERGDDRMELVLSQAVPVRLGGAHASTIPCRSHDADLWFSDTPEGVEEAKALCGGCPLQAACLEGALERAEPWGVWGGQLVLSGEVVARKRPRGRPRKEWAAA